MVLTRMIFAIQTTDPQPTRVRVSGNVGTPAPAMTYVRRGGGAPSSVSCVDGAWTMDLDAGDYIVSIQVGDDDWVAGRLDIAAELTARQSYPIFIYYGPLPESSPPADGLVAWAGTTLYIDPPETSAIGDSKDPWPPPPPPPPPRLTLAPASETWFTTELAAARPQIATANAGKCPPAGVGRLVTEP